MKYIRMQFPLFAVALVLTTVRAADLTPAETKTIAEEGFIYGLPIVMNYAVMYEYAVDKNSSQFKAPFNQLNSMHRVATPEDRIPLSVAGDQRLQTLGAAHGCAS